MPGIPFSPEHNITPEAQVNAGLLSSNNYVTRWLQAGLALLFPPRCAGCGRVDTEWCPTCQHELSQIPLAIQLRPVQGFQSLASTGIHTGMLRKAVMGLKYANTPLLRQPLGERMLTCLSRLNWTIDTIIPVPLHMNRLRERGYNQAQLLAEYAAAGVQLPCKPQALHRQRYTQSQVGLGARERKMNVAEAFQANSRDIENQTILLVDDVCTTGSTLSACAQALLTAGAVAVYGLTVTTAQAINDG